MISEGDKYRAELLKILGCSLATPLGILILNIANPDFWKLSWNLILYIIISFVSFYCAIIVLRRGLHMVDED